MTNWKNVAHVLRRRANLFDRMYTNSLVRLDALRAKAHRWRAIEWAAEEYAAAVAHERAVVNACEDEGMQHHNHRQCSAAMHRAEEALDELRAALAIPVATEPKS